MSLVGILLKKIQFNVIIFVLVTSFLLFQGIFIYKQYKSSVHNVGNVAIAISKSIEQFVNIDEYKNIITSKDKSSYFYGMQKFFSELQRNTGAKYIYIERRLSDTEIEYIFDSEKDSLGEKDENTTPIEYNTKYMPSFFKGASYYNKWGSLISGYTPLLNEHGVVIGLVGVDFTLDYSLSYFYNDLTRLILYISIVLLYFIAFLFLILHKRKLEQNNIKKAYNSIVNSLFKSLEKKSGYTWEHSKKVSEYSVALAKELGIDKNNLKALEWAAMLHDVGKIGVPETILNKASRLSPEEYNIIKLHPVYSKDILSEIFQDENTIFNVKEFNIITDIANFHHERWDGKGYPDGLKGDNIPLMSRIVSVTDSWEAMTAHRPYKSPMRKEQALQEIRLNSGTQFDPKVVDAFLKCIDKNLI